jgi:hypothetical protein
LEFMLKEIELSSIIVKFTVPNEIIEEKVNYEKARIKSADSDPDNIIYFIVLRSSTC